MQYDAETHADYIAGLSNDWRRTTLLVLRDRILSHGRHMPDTDQVDTGP